MDRVEQIEAAIIELRPEEHQKLADWFRSREQARWDEQMDRDSSSGKLDFLCHVADDEIARHATHDCPPE